MDTIPFFIADIWQGLLKGHGLVALQGDRFRLEIQVDSFTGLIKARQMSREVPLSDVESISMRSYLFGLYTVLSVQGVRMDVFAGFPGSRGGRCRLRIARRDRQNCAAFVQHFAEAKAAEIPSYRRAYTALHNGWSIRFQGYVHMYCHRLTATKDRWHYDVACESTPDGFLAAWPHGLALEEPVFRDLLKGLREWADSTGRAYRIYTSRDEYLTNEPQPQQGGA